jgi:hypothetical protein
MMFCPIETGSDVAVSRVDGVMKQPGSVSIGHLTDFETTADWQFRMLSPHGAYDLVAIEANASRIAIRRGQIIERDTTVAAIDLDREGRPLVEFPAIVTNLLPAESTFLSVALTTSTDTVAFIHDVRRPMMVVPEAVLLPTDMQRMRATGTVSSIVPGRGGTSYLRSTERPITASGSAEFTLPAPLDAIFFSRSRGALTATWSALPAFDLLELEATALFTDGFAKITYHADVSSSYIDATGITSVAFDSDIPHFLPRWSFDFTASYQQIATVTQKGAEAHVSSVTEIVNTPTLTGLLIPRR